jgi:dTDP-4-amino-4,6-dideoxygalactose transaminase
MGKKVGKHKKLPVTDRVSDTLIRLPLYYGLSAKDVDMIVDDIKTFFQERKV